MTEAALVQTFDWVVRFAMLGVVTYAVWVIHREKALAARLVDRLVCRRLAELLPLPHVGDRGTLIAMLREIAPAHDIAIYTAGQPALLVARRREHAPPGAEEARFIEVHRDALLGGQIVREPACGTLVPLRLPNGFLTGTIIVATLEKLRLDDTARATLRHVAGFIAWTPLLTSLALPDGRPPRAQA